MSIHEIAADDVVRSHEEGAQNERPPLLVLDPLLAFLDAVGLGDGEPEVQPVGDGHSNVTYLVTRGDAEFVVRRPPRGPLPPSAHDVLREHRILSALQGSRVPVPPTNASRREAAFRLVDTLAALHQVDVDAVGLGDLGPRNDYLARQLARMHQVWQRTKTREYPLIDELHARLQQDCPPQVHTGLVHSDYRFGNVILGPDGAPAAVLDWELCALGDVLVDLGFLLANWDAPEDPWPNVWLAMPPTRAGGFPSRAEMVARYEAATGWDVSRIHYYRAFVLWRIAIIAEGIKRRYGSGAMGAKQGDLDVLEQRVRDRAELAAQALEASGAAF